MLKSIVAVFTSFDNINIVHSEMGHPARDVSHERGKVFGKSFSHISETTFRTTRDAAQEICAREMEMCCEKEKVRTSGAAPEH